MKKELKINVERFGGTGVVVEVVDMDDSERGEGVLIENEDNLVIKSIQSLSFPELRGDELFVWGGDRYEDDRIFGHRFASEEMRERAIDDINSLVNLAIVKLFRKNKNPNFVLTKNNLIKI